VLAGESEDRLDIGIWVRGVRDMPSTRKRTDLDARQRLGELGNHRGEGRWTLVAERKEGWLGEPSHPCEIESQLLWIVRLVKKGWCVLDERLLELERQLRPRARSKCHGLNELFSGTGMVACGDPLDHGSNPLIDFREQRGDGGVLGEEREQRRLVAEQAAEEIRARRPAAAR
jgi:hypothetical protein